MHMLDYVPEKSGSVSATLHWCISHLAVFPIVSSTHAGAQGNDKHFAPLPNSDNQGAYMDVAH